MDPDKAKTEKEPRNENKNAQRYTFNEDMAIIKYMTTNKRYLRASGIKVWQEAEELQICPNRPYQSMKERFRKFIIRNLKKYNLDKELTIQITQFMRANKNGKRTIRHKEFSH